MKYYQLTKDMPTFKKGELFWMDEHGSLISNDWNIVAYAGSTIAKFPNILEDWFKEVHKPLIKDEKARKVFREWAGLFDAELFRVTHLFCSGKRGATIVRSTDLTTEPSIELPGYIGEDSEIYTRVELCGEEEE